MVERITMDKGNFLGYGNLEDLELIGRAFGYDIHIEKIERTCMTAWVYDRNVTKRVRNVEGYMETRYRIAAKVELSKDRGAWHIDLVNVDSRYKGKNLAVKCSADGGSPAVKDRRITIFPGHIRVLCRDDLICCSCNLTDTCSNDRLNLPIRDAGYLPTRCNHSVD